MTSGWDAIHGSVGCGATFPIAACNSVGRRDGEVQLCWERRDGGVQVCRETGRWGAGLSGDGTVGCRSVGSDGTAETGRWGAALSGDTGRRGDESAAQISVPAEAGS